MQLFRTVLELFATICGARAPLLQMLTGKASVSGRGMGVGGGNVSGAGGGCDNVGGASGGCGNVGGAGGSLEAADPKTVFQYLFMRARFIHQSCHSLLKSSFRFL